MIDDDSGARNPPQRLHASSVQRCNTCVQDVARPLSPVNCRRSKLYRYCCDDPESMQWQQWTTYIARLDVLLFEQRAGEEDGRLQVSVVWCGDWSKGSVKELLIRFGPGDT